MDATMTVVDGDRSRKRGIRRAILAFIFAIVALTFFSSTLLNLSLAEVETGQAISGPLSHQVTGFGTVEAAETVDLYVETNWAASDVLVKVGDHVKAGQELVAFKTRDVEDSLKDNQAKYEQKRLNLEKLQDNYAEALRSGDDKQMRSITRDIRVTNLDLQILDRQIAAQQRQLAEYSRLTAPVAGIVTEVNAVKGAPVQSGKSTVSIADLSKGQQLKATIDDIKAQYVAVGDETELVFSTLNNARIKAKVYDIRDAVPTSGQGASTGSSSQSGLEGKEITFTLRDDRLNGGEKGEFDIIKKTPAFRMLLPNDAVREDDTGKFVLILKEKKGPLGSEYVVQRAAVQTGDADDTKTSIENGVTPLDKIVISSSKQIADGDRVLGRN